MYRSGLFNTLVTHATMNGLGLTPLFGDRRGYMPPQLKTNKNDFENKKRIFLIAFFQSNVGGMKTTFHLTVYGRKDKKTFRITC